MGKEIRDLIRIKEWTVGVFWLIGVYVRVKLNVCFGNWIKDVFKLAIFSLIKNNSLTIE